MTAVLTPSAVIRPALDDLAMLRRIEARVEERFYASKCRVIERTAAGATTYSAIGNPSVLADAAYDRGALGVTVVVLP